MVKEIKKIGGPWLRFFSIEFNKNGKMAYFVKRLAL